MRTWIVGYCKSCLCIGVLIHNYLLLMTLEPVRLLAAHLEGHCGRRGCLCGESADTKGAWIDAY